MSETSRSRLRDVWLIFPEPFHGAHFATFPKGLAALCILAGCPEGGTVLDPFGGSGTVSLVARRLGRNSIYVDLNPDYARMAVDRCGPWNQPYLDGSVDTYDLVEVGA